MDPIRERLNSTPPYVLRQRRLATFLRTNGGVITSAELADLGFDRPATRTLLTAHRLVRVHNRVYRDGTIPPSVDAANRAGLASVGRGSMLGLESAAHQQALLMFAPGNVQIVVPGRRRVSDRKGVDIHRFPDVEPGDIVSAGGVRSTGPARTALDLAGAVRSERQWRALRRTVRQAVKLNATVAPRLRSEVGGDASFPGAALLRAILDQDLLGAPMLRSTLEEDFLDFCVARGLPLPEMNAVIEGLEVDALWRLQRVVVELDTWDHHADELAFERDRERDEFLRERGWPVSRITGRRLALQSDRIETQLRRRLGLL